MQLVYLDESGTGDLKKEPDTIVAGIIVDADKQAVRVRKYLNDLADEYAPPRHREGFIFHAKELANGGKLFPRDANEERRLAILDQICAIPRIFDLGVVAGAFRRAEMFDENPKLKLNDATTQALAASALMCMTHVESFMRSLPDNELACIFFEDNHLSRRLIRRVMRVFSNPRDENVKALLPQILPLSKIMPEISFQEKVDSSLLQVADACAFALRRRIKEGPRGGRFYDQFSLQLLPSVAHALSVTSPPGLG